MFYMIYTMKDSDIPNLVKPAKIKAYKLKRSRYDVAQGMPFSQIVVGPSGSGGYNKYKTYQKY